MSTKLKKREKFKTVEDIYRNNNFVPPKEQNLETIFEEPRQSKDGVPILTSVKKYKRYLHFDPTQNKIQKRKRKAKKCFKKLKTNNRITRSSPEASQCEDISMYILGVMGDVSSDSDMEASHEMNKRKTFSDSCVKMERRAAVETNAASSSQEVLSCSDVFDTPKRPHNVSRTADEPLDNDKDSSRTICSESENHNGKITADTSVKDTESSVRSTNSPDANETSPRRSCIVS